VTICWSKTDALKAPHTIYIEDQFWNDSTNTGLFRVDMKNGLYTAGTGITVVPKGDSLCLTINLTTVDGFKIVYDLTSGVEPTPVVAGSYTLSSNIPNPFAKSTEINFYAPVRGDMKLEVFDMKGNLVNTLISGMTEAGAHTALWNGTDTQGKAVATGSYVYRLTAGSTVLSKTMVLVR
jgi:hypothetical protein